MRYHELLEAPISDFNFHGDMEAPGTFRKDDLKKFNDPVWKERVIKLFRNAPVDISLHIVNGEGDKISMRGKTWTDKLDVSVEQIKKYVGIQSPQWAESILGKSLDTEGKITVMLLQNEGAARVGLTPWMVGHRIAHCFIEKNDRHPNAQLIALSDRAMVALSSLFTSLSRHHFAFGYSTPSEDIIGEIAKVISSFRSARTGNLNNSGEYLVELFTTYLIRGKVRFERDWIGTPERVKKLTDQQQAILNTAREIPYVNSSRFEILEYSDEALNDLFNNMRGNPLRPRTKSKLRDACIEMIDNELYDVSPNAAWTKEETLHYYLSSTEKKLDDIFRAMLDSAVGKIVVL